jgi:hypothetical protein
MAPQLKHSKDCENMILPMIGARRPDRIPIAETGYWTRCNPNS